MSFQSSSMDVVLMTRCHCTFLATPLPFQERSLPTSKWLRICMHVQPSGNGECISFSLPRSSLRCQFHLHQNGENFVTTCILFSLHKSLSTIFFHSNQCFLFVCCFSIILVLHFCWNDIETTLKPKKRPTSEYFFVGRRWFSGWEWQRNNITNMDVWHIKEQPFNVLYPIVGQITFGDIVFLNKRGRDGGWGRPTRKNGANHEFSKAYKFANFEATYMLQRQG